MGRQIVIGISKSPIWSKTLMKLIPIPVVNFDEAWRAQLAKSTILTWGAERNGKIPHLIIPSKTATIGS